MDTTKKRILMCEEAEEIQRRWKPENGDCYIYKPTGNLGMVCLDNPVFESETEHRIWLPRQDQLQGIYIGNNEDTLDRMFSLCNSFTDKSYISHWKPWHFFTSMEQLWLAFVMREKYNKVWDGKDWIK